MKVLFSFFILFHFCIYCNAQLIARKIVDSQSGVPLSYATIKVLHVPKGAIASDKGEFTLTIDPSDSVLFTYVGYKQKILVGKEVEPVVYLEKKIQILEEITIGEKKLIRTILIDDKYKKLKEDINWGPSNGGKDELAQKIDLPDSSLYYKIKKIYVPARKFGCFGSVLIHIYGMDSVSEHPGEELFLKYVDVNKNFRNKKIIIDLSTENFILHNRKCFFVSLGWPDEAFFDKCITTVLLSKSAKAQTFSRSLNNTSYSWHKFGHLVDLKGASFDVATFYSVEVDEMK